MQYVFGYIDLEHRTLQTSASPFGSRVSPRSYVQSVTHVSGSDTRESGGGGGIRTHDGLPPMPVFKTGALNRSATPPGDGKGRRNRGRRAELATPPAAANPGSVVWRRTWLARPHLKSEEHTSELQSPRRTS